MDVFIASGGVLKDLPLRGKNVKVKDYSYLHTTQKNQ